MYPRNRPNPGGGIYLGNEQDGPGCVGMMTINMMTCQLNVMGPGSTQPSSTVSIREMLAEMLTLEDASDSED